MTGLTRDGTAESVSRDQMLRRERGQRKKQFPCSADRDQDSQPNPVDPYSSRSGGHPHAECVHMMHAQHRFSATTNSSKIRCAMFGLPFVQHNIMITFFTAAAAAAAAAAGVESLLLVVVQYSNRWC